MEKINQIGDIYNPETVSKYYDKREAYDRIHPADALFVDLIPARMDGKVALDVGCGDGRYSALMLRHGSKQVKAIDLSPSMIERVQERKERFKLDALEVIQADIDHLPVDRESADFVLSRFSLMYSGKLREAVKGLGEALKMGGEAVVEASVAEIGDPAKKEVIKGIPVPLRLRVVKEIVDIKNYPYTLEDYLEAFREADLAVEVQERFPADDLSVAEEYGHKDAVTFDYIVFKLRKQQPNA